MEIDSGMEGLPLPEPERVQKPKRKWDPDMELTWEQKALLVLDICREQLLARSYPDGCNVVPTSFFDLPKECEAGSSSAIPEQSTGGSNKTLNSSIDGAGSCVCVVSSELDQRKGDQELSDEDKIRALHVVRCNEFTEYNPKYAKVGLGPPSNKLTPYELMSLESSINMISLKITESDLGYPINVFGTVIARDEVDYKCVYLFKRDREDPQLIKSSNDGLNLTGPYRGLAISDVMCFEYNLKICDGTRDRTLSKGAIEFNTARYSNTTISKRFTSWLSTVELVLTRVACALEATLTVTVLKGPPDFYGRITAWTTGNKDDHIILFDSEPSGTQKSTRGGCVALSHVISVTFDEQLVLCFSVGCNQIVLMLGQNSKNCTCKIGSYELLVEVSWTANVSSRQKNVLRLLGRALVVV